MLELGSVSSHFCSHKSRFAPVCSPFRPPPPTGKCLNSKQKNCKKAIKAGAPCEWIEIPDRGTGGCGGSYGCHSKYAGCNDYTCEQVCNTRSDCFWNGGKCRPACGLVGDECEFSYEFWTRELAEPTDEGKELADLKTVIAARKAVSTERNLADTYARAKSTCCEMDIYGGAMQCSPGDADNDGIRGEPKHNYCCFASPGQPCEDNVQCCQLPNTHLGTVGLRCRQGTCRPVPLN